MRSGEVFMPGNSGRQEKKIFENATIKGLMVCLGTKTPQYWLFEREIHP